MLRRVTGGSNSTCVKMYLNATWLHCTRSQYCSSVGHLIYASHVTFWYVATHVGSIVRCNVLRFFFHNERMRTERTVHCSECNEVVYVLVSTSSFLPFKRTFANSKCTVHTECGFDVDYVLGATQGEWLWEVRQSDRPHRVEDR